MWLSQILALCSGPTRTKIGALVFLRIIGRLFVVVTAALVARGTVVSATTAGVAAAATLLAQRLLQMGTRTSVERDLYRATARAFLAADALEVDEANPSREFMGGIYNAGRLLYESLPALLGDGVALLFVVPWLLYASAARFILVVAVVGAILVAGSLVIRRRARAVETLSSDALRAVLDQLFGAVDGRLELIASGRDESFRQRFDVALGNYHRLALRMGVISAFLGRVPIAAAVAVVLVIAVADSSSREVLTRAFLSQALVLTACLPVGLGLLLGAHGLARARAQLAPFLRLFDRPMRAEAGQARVGLPARFVARRVTFAYDAGRPPVFEDLSFDWPSGVLVAVGPNGSGKSTILKLLMGLRTVQKGELTNDGQSLTEIDLHAWRRRIAYLPQRPYLGEPYTTIRASMRFFDEDVADAAMVSALETIGLDKMLHGRGKLLETRVGELSAGQRQRLGLARLLLQDASLVVLDEPDANLDTAGIELVGQLIDRMKADGKMVAIAAHTRELSARADVLVDLTL